MFGFSSPQINPQQSSQKQFKFRPKLDDLERRLAPAIITEADNYTAIAGRTLSATVSSGSGGGGFFSNRGVLRNDRDTSDTPPDEGSNRNLTASLVSSPIDVATGLPITTPFVFNPNGSFSFRSPRNYNGIVTFQYKATNTNTAEVSSDTTVTINVTGPIRRLAFGADEGGSPRVLVYDATGNFPLFDFMAFDKKFTGGVRVATGDFNGDNIDDIVAAAGPGGGPHVKIFDGNTGFLFREFYVYDSGFAGGVSVATGDVTGDNVEDIIVAPAGRGGPHVRVFQVSSTMEPTLHSEFFAYSLDFLGGVRMAIGDAETNGINQIITAPGFGGNPHIKIWDVSSGDGTLRREFFGDNPNNPVGANVAAGDFNGDYTDDIAVGTGAGAPVVRIYNGKNLGRFDQTTGQVSGGLTGFVGGLPSQLIANATSTPSNSSPSANYQVGTIRPPSFIPTGLTNNVLNPPPGALTGYTYGARIAVSYADFDDFADLVLVTGPNDYPRFRVFSGEDNTTLQDFALFENHFFGGIWAAGHG